MSTTSPVDHHSTFALNTAFDNWVLTPDALRRFSDKNPVEFVNSLDGIAKINAALGKIEKSLPLLDVSSQQNGMEKHEGGPDRGITILKIRELALRKSLIKLNQYGKRAGYTADQLSVLKKTIEPKLQGLLAEVSKLQSLPARSSIKGLITKRLKVGYYLEATPVGVQADDIPKVIYEKNGWYRSVVPVTFCGHQSKYSSVAAQPEHILCIIVIGFDNRPDPVQKAAFLPIRTDSERRGDTFVRTGQ